MVCLLVITLVVGCFAGIVFDKKQVIQCLGSRYFFRFRDSWRYFPDDRLVLAASDENNTLPVLGDAIVRSVQDNLFIDMVKAYGICQFFQRIYFLIA